MDIQHFAVKTKGEVDYEKEDCNYSIVLFACLLVVMFCASLVSCNDDEKSNGIRFSDDMNKEEMLEKLKEVKNYSFQVHYTDILAEGSDNKDDYYYLEYRFSETWFYSECGFGKAELCEWMYVENNRTYDIRKELQPDGTWESEVAVIDFSGYDIDELKMDSFSLESGIEDIVYLIENMEYTIEDGGFKTDIESGYEIAKGFNTTVIELPDEYKDYKNLEAESPIQYELSEDGTYYVLTDINSRIKTYTVPQMYNGKAVKGISEWSPTWRFETLTISTNIEKMPESLWNINGVHIIYEGTMAQWEAVENQKWWSSYVTCLDGTIGGDSEGNDI